MRVWLTRVFFRVNTGCECTGGYVLQLVSNEFKGNSLFQKALKDAFEVFINKEVNSKHSNAEMICAFCDRLLKSGGYVIPASCLV